MNLRNMAVHSKKMDFFGSSADSHATNWPNWTFMVLFCHEIVEIAWAHVFFYLLGSLNDVFF